MIKLLVVTLIGYLYSVFPSTLYFRSHLLGTINNYTFYLSSSESWSMGKIPYPPSPSHPKLKLFLRILKINEIFKLLCSYFYVSWMCCLSCLRYKNLYKNTIQRSILMLDSCEWQGVWCSMGKSLGQPSAPLLELCPGISAESEKLLKYLEKYTICLEIQRHESLQCAETWPRPTESCSIK